MKRRSLIFTAPSQLQIQEEDLPAPGPGQVQVFTLLTAISPGTELLFYRGQFPPDLSVDASIAALQAQSAYPLKYGYSLVGQVAALGSGVDPGWRDRLVFSFHPHESAFNTAPEELFPVPDGMPAEEAVFLPNMETAVSLVMDGQPRIGERVAVFGQGIVGLLTTALLAYFPLAQLITLDPLPLRRQASLQAGAFTSLEPGPAAIEAFPEGTDLSYELSGSPAALDQAIALTGFAGRVVIGSWYGLKPAALNLGGRFHRSRIRLISSQVSTLDPALSGRWTKPRRLAVAWDMLRAVRPARWVTHRLPFSQAPQAFELLDSSPHTCIQVLLQYT